MADHPICIRCGKPVQPPNDLAQLYRVTAHLKLIEGIFEPNTSRHILPAGDCPGTPGISQYLEGQPPPTDGDIEYDEYLKAIIRAGYLELTSSMLTCKPPDIP